MLEVARRRVPGVAAGRCTLVESDFFQYLETDSDRHSLVTCVGCLHHLPVDAFEIFFRLVHTRLADKGQLLLAEPVDTGGRTAPALVTRWNAKSVMVTRAPLMPMEESHEAPISADVLLQQPERFGFRRVIVSRSWEMFQHGLPATAFDQGALRMRGGHGNVVAALWEAICSAPGAQCASAAVRALETVSRPPDQTAAAMALPTSSVVALPPMSGVLAPGLHQHAHDAEDGSRSVGMTQVSSISADQIRRSDWRCPPAIRGRTVHRLEQRRMLPPGLMLPDGAMPIADRDRDPTGCHRTGSSRRRRRTARPRDEMRHEDVDVELIGPDARIAPATPGSARPSTAS
jgi:hypothetical protein